jgi:presenilin-like A22 family membrane protease
MNLCFVTSAIFPITCFSLFIYVTTERWILKKLFYCGINKTQYFYIVILYQCRKPDYGFNRKSIPKAVPCLYLKGQSAINISQTLLTFNKGIKTINLEVSLKHIYVSIFRDFFLW